MQTYLEVRNSKAIMQSVIKDWLATVTYYFYYDTIRDETIYMYLGLRILKKLTKNRFNLVHGAKNGKKLKKN